MGRELTLRHSSLFEKKVRQPFLFVRDVYRYGKSRELVSFIVWELLHRFRLFPKTNYLTFADGAALELDGAPFTDLAFRDQIRRFFKGRGLRATRSEHNWKLLFIHDNGTIFGCLYPSDTDLYRSTDHGASITFVQRFSDNIKSIFISSRNTLFVCVKGAVYRSLDNGGSFEKSLDLGSPESFFRHNNAMTETPHKMLIIGEYGNVWEKNGWRKLAYLYYSSDDGQTWDRSDFLMRQGTNKHVHLVKYSRLLNKMLMADGDNKKKLWVSDAIDRSDHNPKWKPVNRFHIQMGGYTSIVESDGKILFGTDYQGGTNFIVESTDGENFVKRIVPDPYRRSPIHNMVQRRTKKGHEIWATLPYSTANTRCLLMYSGNSGESWSKAIEYRSGAHAVWLISSANEPADDVYVSVENAKSGDRAVYRMSSLES